MKKHIYIFDYLRALAAVGVVLFHYTVRFSELFEQSEGILVSVPYGYMGVTTFFVLSGFLTVLTLKEDTTPLRWGKTRFLRLYPVYWVAMIITFVVTSLWLPERSVSIQTFFVNVTMLNDFVNVGYVDGAYWTLHYELTFYALILFVLLSRKTKYLKELSWLWLFLAIAYSFFTKFMKIPHLMEQILLTQYISTFVIGVTFATMMKRQSSFDCPMLLLAFLYFGMKNGPEYSIYLAVVMIVFSLLNYYKSVREWIAPKIIHNLLVFIAGVSYPLYLIHQNVGYVVIKTMEGLGVPANIAVLCAVCMAFGMAYLLNEVEHRVLYPFWAKHIL